MSVLTNVLRTMFLGNRQPTSLAEPLPVAAVEPDVPQEEAEGPPAWRLLGTQTGVQDGGYGDIARPGVQALFRREPARLLDIGCASGAVGAWLKQAFPALWVWGCEPSQHSAQLAASRLDHFTGVPRSQWSAADLDRVSTVDTVLLLDVLEHMYNPWAELEFLSQHLPQDAQVIVSLPNIGHLSTLEALSFGTFRYRPAGILDVTHVRFFTFTEMMTMFEQTGFVVETSGVLSRTPNAPLAVYPAHVAVGKVVVNVASAEEWERLNAIQFGFRLRPAPRPAAA